MASQAKVLGRVRIVNLLLSLLGLALSAYSVYVGYRKGIDSKYKAFCDIDKNIQCSSVLTSKYSKGFGFLANFLGNDSPLVVSNGIYGIAFYAIVILLGELSYAAAAHVQRILVFLSNGMSAYLAYILFFVLKDICVVCISTYVINALLSICCFVRVRNLPAAGKGGKKQKNQNQQKGQKGKQQQQQQQNQKKNKQKNNNNSNNVKAEKKQTENQQQSNKGNKESNANNKKNKQSNNSKKNK